MLVADRQLPAALPAGDPQLLEGLDALGELRVALLIDRVVHQVPGAASRWRLERDVVPGGVVVDEPTADTECSSYFGLGVRNAELTYLLSQLESLLGADVVLIEGQGSRFNPTPNKRLRRRRHLVAVGDGLRFVADGRRFFDLAAAGQELGDLGRQFIRGRA
ncbi:hypothetical protein HX786_00705 [Pseudomonas sp. 21615526]|uniref:hypothetical protein n=1 Tax=Pseudomonas sp. 21615526 TaxID=2738811 RepID=UPI0015BCAB7D|nr:hypothetical protein [Pseudomonas sp. 21615526]NVZ36574.1 hypothetical protein [Pseudomonas sp. 21615526]